jgi:hypothetical protein
MDGAIFLLLAITCESVPRKNDAVLFIRQNVLYILLKRTARRRHSLLGKLIKTLLATVRASDRSLSRNVEIPILRTSTEIAVQIPTRECGVRFSDDRFYWMCHDPLVICGRLAPAERQYATPRIADRRSWLTGMREYFLERGYQKLDGGLRPRRFA